jgi:hypothetical protein
MDQSPLVIDRIDAATRFLGEFQKYMPVQAAFWVKETDTGEWYLYLASEKITDENFDVVYEEVLRIAAEMGEPLFDPFLVKVIGADHRLAKAALEIRRRYPSPAATHFHGDVFGGIPVEQIYLYPAPIPVPA